MKLIANQVQLDKMDKYQLANLNKEIVAELDWINANIKRTTEELENLKEQQTTIQTLMKGNVQLTNAMVPLTETLTVEGTIEFTNRIIIPIGSKFFVSKPIDKACAIYEQRIKDKEKEKRAYEILLNDRQTVLKRMEVIIKRLVTIEQIVLSQNNIVLKK